MSKTIYITESQLVNIMKESMGPYVSDSEEPDNIGEVGIVSKMGDGKSGKMPTTDKIGDEVRSSSRRFGVTFRGRHDFNYMNEGNLDFKGRQFHIGRTATDSAKSCDGIMMRNISSENGMKPGTAYKRKHDLLRKGKLTDSEKTVLDGITNTLDREEALSRNKKKLASLNGKNNAYQKEGGDKNTYGTTSGGAHTSKNEYVF